MEENLWKCADCELDLETKHEHDQHVSACPRRRKKMKMEDESSDKINIHENPEVSTLRSLQEYKINTSFKSENTLNKEPEELIEYDIIGNSDDIKKEENNTDSNEELTSAIIIKQEILENNQNIKREFQDSDFYIEIDSDEEIVNEDQIGETTINHNIEHIKNIDGNTIKNSFSNKEDLNLHMKKETPQENSHLMISNDLAIPNIIQLVESEYPLSEADNKEELKGAYLFRQLYSSTNIQICLLCNAYFDSIQYLVEHYRGTHQIDTELFRAKFNCEDKVYIYIPADLDESLMTRNLTCSFCNVPTMQCTDTLRTHLLESHGKILKCIQESELIGQPVSFFCSICSNTSSEFGDHYKHLEMEHNHTCNFCPFSTVGVDILKSHVEEKHMQLKRPMEEQYNLCNTCVVCQRNLRGRNNLREHILTAHSLKVGPGIWACLLCQRFSSSPSNLIDHFSFCQKYQKFTKDQTSEKAIDSSKENKTCFLCDMQFQSHNLLLSHMFHVHMQWVDEAVYDCSEQDSLGSCDDIICIEKLHESATEGNLDELEKPQYAARINETLAVLQNEADLSKLGYPFKYGHYCYLCDILISSYPLFYCHMRYLHRLEKRFQCIISDCGKSFKSIAGFESHTETHPQNMDWHCSLCDCIFTSEQELNHHQNTKQHVQRFLGCQNTENPYEPRNYKCSDCHIWFGLNQNFISHKEERNQDYECEDCNASFYQAIQRRQHIEYYHPEKTMICEMCDGRFQNYEDIALHMREHGLYHTCPLCQENFSSMEHLSIHKEVHCSTIRCTWGEGCCEIFPTRDSLMKHYNMHDLKDKYKKRISNLPKEYPALKTEFIEADANTHSNTTALVQDPMLPINPPDDNENKFKQVCQCCLREFMDFEEYNSHQCQDDSFITSAKSPPIKNEQLFPKMQDNESVNYPGAVPDDIGVFNGGDKYQLVKTESGDSEEYNSNQCQDNSITPTKNEQLLPKIQDNESVNYPEAVPDDNGVFFYDGDKYQLVKTESGDFVGVLL